jgi:general secretion pathway protein K
MKLLRLPAAARTERGAALLLALIVLTLVATTAAGMVWQQSRAIHVEAAERARAQAWWMLDALVDGGRYVVRQRTGRDPSQGAPWDFRLEEMSLSSLLAADRENNAGIELQAYFSGHVVDAQSRYNLRNLFDGEGKEIEAERKALDRLCALAGATGFAPAIAAALAAARAPVVQGPVPDPNVATMPVTTRVEHLRWLGIDETTLARLMQIVDLLPEGPTRLNLNTASAEVIAAVLGIEVGEGQRIERVNGPQNARFKDLADANSRLGLSGDKALPEARVDVRSDWFYFHGQVRYEDRVLATRALVKSEGQGAGSAVNVRRLERGPVRLDGPEARRQ